MKIKKILICLLLVICVINIFPQKINAFSGLGNTINKGREFLEVGMVDQKISTTDLQKNLGPIANALTAIGFVVLIVVIVIMGIKYMTASPEEAAKLKQQLIGVVVAGIVIFGAVTIWKIAYQVMTTIAD